MTKVLVLGGTAWLGSRVAARWAAEGAEVVCLARGTGPVPAGVRLVVADRSLPGAYDEVAGEEWDEVVDVSRIPEHVRSAAAALSRRTGHETFVSSMSVYAQDDVVGADESAPLHDAAQPGDEYDYARAKSACERTLGEALPGRLAVLRPGLIVGPGDPTDRFGYWVSRFALAGDEPVLAPDTVDRHAQVIDVDDLTEAVVAAGRTRWEGTANAIGDDMPLGRMLELARGVAGHRGPVVTASDARLAEAGIAHWAGPRSLPLWLPPDMPGFMTRSNDVYRARGWPLRPVEETLVRTLADERSRGLSRPRASGLERAEELAELSRIR